MEKYKKITFKKNNLDKHIKKHKITYFIKIRVFLKKKNLNKLTQLYNSSPNYIIHHRNKHNATQQHNYVSYMICF